jgi:polar amino acid transport system permease protein
MFDLSFLLHDGYIGLFRDGLLTTLRLFVVSGVLALAIGVAIATLRALPARLCKAFVVLVVEYHRNVPVLVQILVWYFGVPQLLPEGIKAWVNAGNSEFIFAAVALAMNSGAFISEDLRSGLRAIPRTQEEAAWSIGLTYLQGFRYVILPQGIPCPCRRCSTKRCCCSRTAASRWRSACMNCFTVPSRSTTRRSVPSTFPSWPRCCISPARWR